MAAYRIGDAVQTPFGKGVVRQLRNGQRLLVDVQGRAFETDSAAVTPLTERRRRAAPNAIAPGGGPDAEASGRRIEIDLHGFTVDQALARLDHELNAALLAGAAELRVIHGRSGGRIRSAVHVRLRAIASVRGFRLDPRNDGVTIVAL